MDDNTKVSLKKELESFPKMTSWYNPIVLWKTYWKMLTSLTFGEFADRRLIQAALNPQNIIEDTNYKDIGCSNNGMWVDYVADLGDGFDSTYSIAYLLAQKETPLSSTDKEPITLPRGQILIMGGDQIYPFANRDDYKLKLNTPYNYAFPDSNCDQADHPPLFLLPGNHDWYDGLNIFTTLFCKGKNKKFGKSSWRVQQNRSYFAIELRDNWWLWGIDSQLTLDIDIPQADYFQKIAESLREKQDIKIILFVSTPTWVEKEQDRTKKGIKFISNDILKQIVPCAKIYTILTGDSHHYSRYKGAESNIEYITAGGGGAFLHPTHHLVDSTEKISWKNGEEILNKKCTFPDKEESIKLASSQTPLKFLKNNSLFLLPMSIIYGILALILVFSMNPILISFKMPLINKLECQSKA